jgi:Family of unknown function (DUF5343)
MALTNAYVLPSGRIPDLFQKIRDGQPPERFTSQQLKDWGFTSTNDRAFIGLLKALGFLTTDGRPTQRYSDYRDHTRSKAVLGEGLKEAYGDIFLIKENPAESDRAAIQGKFKSFHNANDNVATLMARTFMALLPLATLPKKGRPPPPPAEEDKPPPKKRGKHKEAEEEEEEAEDRVRIKTPGLHYNIEIHLPATKDVEVYNAIFKSLREHLIGK